MLNLKKVIAFLLLFGSVITTAESNSNLKKVKINAESRSVAAIAPDAGPSPIIGPIVVGAAAAAGAAAAYNADHRTNTRPSNKPKHELGQARKKRDQGGEKKDKSGRYVPNRRNRR